MMPEEMSSCHQNKAKHKLRGLLNARRELQLSCIQPASDRGKEGAVSSAIQAPAAPLMLGIRRRPMHLSCTSSRRCGPGCEPHSIAGLSFWDSLKRRLMPPQTPSNEAHDAVSRPELMDFCRICISSLRFSSSSGPSRPSASTLLALFPLSMRLANAVLFGTALEKIFLRLGMCPDLRIGEHASPHVRASLFMMGLMPLMSLMGLMPLMSLMVWSSPRGREEIISA
jgi:hypothetical protein